MSYTVEHTYDREPPVVVTEIFEDKALARLVQKHFQMVADYHRKTHHRDSTVTLTGPGMIPEVYSTKEGEDAW